MYYASEYYYSISIELGDDFVDKYSLALNEVRHNSHHYLIIDRVANVRRIMLDRFPYKIYYTILVGGSVEVYALFHAHADIEPLTKRWL